MTKLARRQFHQRLTGVTGVVGLLCLGLFPLTALAQDDLDLSIDNIEIPEARLPACFGFRDIADLRALSICDALNLDLNVKARELSEQWIRSEPESPAAQYALAEVLLTVEGNMPRALFHLNRAEELTNYDSLEAAILSGNVQWHYLALSQLSYVHQLMGDQLRSLEYLEKMKDIYALEIESFRGWPLIKLKQYDAARASANLVLQNSEDSRERARAWNTLCAVDLASLQPIESMNACDRAIDEDGNPTAQANNTDTVYLSNASEVSLSLLQMDKAEEYLNLATSVLNPDSVANPWIYKMYLLMNQGRFDEAREAMNRMLIWRESQEAIVNVMNRAEHFLVSASFLLLAGYAEDAAKLSATALNQPDRNGSYSADDAQKDSLAALINMMANQTEYQIQLEKLSTLDFMPSLSARIDAASLQVDAWRAERRAASLFAEFDVLQSRLRPYSPLDVHIPEWVEPEIIGLMGTGVMANILEQANDNGAFTLNAGYYYSYHTEIAARENQSERVLEAGALALTELPAQEVLLRARVAAQMATAAWKEDQYGDALAFYEAAYKQDPSILRRLALSLPVTIVNDGAEFSAQVSAYLAKSPRFHQHPNGMRLEVNATPDLSACLKTRTDTVLVCYTMATDETQSSKWNAQQLSQLFHTRAFGLGYDISKAQRSTLLGSSVILSSQNSRSEQRSRDAFLSR